MAINQVDAVMLSRQAPLSATQDAEALLVQRARERSPSAWAEIYDTTYPKLFRYCYARTTNESAAADLASLVYLEALESIDRFEYRGRPLLAWLYRIAHNVTSDYLRKRRRETRALERSASFANASQPSPASEVEHRQDIERALRQLTDDQQQVIALRFFAGLSTFEIACAMERSERAVYSLEVRALAAMRQLIEPAADSEPGSNGSLRRG